MICEPLLAPRAAGNDPLEYWEGAGSALRWDDPWTTLIEGTGHRARWFVGGRLNVAVNCLDRHLDERRDQPAILWEGEPGDRRVLSYGELHDEVSALAAGLLNLGVVPGDRVALYTGLVPECVVAMLACARIGAVHVVLPGTLPVEVLADRLERIRPRIVFTQDGAWRHGMALPLKARADDAQSAFAGVDSTVVIRRTGLDVDWYEGDTWYHDIVADFRGDRHPAPSSFPADHPLLAVAAPNAAGSARLVTHRSAGFLAYASSYHRRATTLDPDDLVWIAAEVAWLAVQAHGIYGPLACGATTVLYEGTLDTPTPARAWEIINRYGVNSLGTTPSVVRRLRRWSGEGFAAEIRSLRFVCTAGEAIDSENQAWLRKDFGPNVSVVSDGWGQMELGGINILDPPPQGSESLPDLGLDVVDPTGAPVVAGEAGELVVRNPWPALCLAIEPADTGQCWKYPDVYATGDLARRDPGGTLANLGRMDDLIKVSGQFVCLIEVAQSLRDHPLVRDVEVVRFETTDHVGILAGVVLDAGANASQATRRELLDHVTDTIGGLARPEVLLFVEDFLPDLPVAARRDVLLSLTRALG